MFSLTKWLDATDGWYPAARMRRNLALNISVILYVLLMILVITYVRIHDQSDSEIKASLSLIVILLLWVLVIEGTLISCAVGHLAYTCRGMVYRNFYYDPRIAPQSIMAILTTLGGEAIVNPPLNQRPPWWKYVRVRFNLPRDETKIIVAKDAPLPVRTIVAIGPISENNGHLLEILQGEIDKKLIYYPKLNRASSEPPESMSGKNISTVAENLTHPPPSL